MNELEGAYRRHSRAGEHLAHLEGIVGQIQQLGEQGVLAEDDPETDDLEPSEEILGPLRLTASVLIGEIVHNLRAALDYLVYVLAENDSGSPQKNTQFLIEDTVQGFTGRNPTALKGVSDEHVAVIRQLQPFKGCEWSRVLRDLDNAAKHRELLSVRIDQNVGSVLTLSEFSVGERDAKGDPLHKGMSMYLKGPVEILLPEGRPVMDTLRELHAQVGFVLQLFTYEFPPG